MKIAGRRATGTMCARAALLSATAVAAWPTHCTADTRDGSGESAFHWSGKVELASDSRERGLSNSANRPSTSLAVELLHDSGTFVELEALKVSKAQYPRGQGVRLQLAGGYRFGDPDAWQFEWGAQHSRFPGARLPGASGYTLVIDPATGEIAGADIVPVDVSPNTTELFGRVTHGPFSAVYFQTVSRDFFGINGNAVCPAIADFAESLTCFERGQAHSRGSRYLELEYTHRLTRPSMLAARLGYQRVRNWSNFNTRSFALEVRYALRSWNLSATLTGARAKDRRAYEVPLADGQVRNTAKTALVLAGALSF